MTTLATLTLIATAISLLTWFFLRRVSDEKPSALKQFIQRFVRSRKTSRKKPPSYCSRLTDSQKRRQARLRRRAIRKSAAFIRAMREEQGLVPVVVTARQRKEVSRVEHRWGRMKGSEGVVVGWGEDKVLWRELKASA